MLPITMPAFGVLEGFAPCLAYSPTLFQPTMSNNRPGCIVKSVFVSPLGYSEQSMLDAIVRSVTRSVMLPELGQFAAVLQR